MLYIKTHVLCENISEFLVLSSKDFRKKKVKKINKYVKYNPRINDCIVSNISVHF